MSGHLAFHSARHRWGVLAGGNGRSSEKMTFMVSIQSASPSPIVADIRILLDGVDVVLRESIWVVIWMPVLAYTE
jgi:hypothetical protein